MHLKLVEVGVEGRKIMKYTNTFAKKYFRIQNRNRQFKQGLPDLNPPPQCEVLKIYSFPEIPWINLIYRVTHKGCDFTDDCTEFVYFVFLHSEFLAGQNWHISVLSYFVNHQNTQLNAKTKNQAYSLHIFRVLGRL